MVSSAESSSTITSPSSAISSNFPATVHNSVPYKLPSSNFALWKAQILPIIYAYNLEGFIDGSSVPSSETISSGYNSASVINEKYLAFYRKDQLVLSWIRPSVTEEICLQIADQNFTREVWPYLEKMFGMQSLAESFQYRSELSSLKKGDSSVFELVNKVKNISMSLAACGKKIDDEDLLLSILNGLGQEYDPDVTSIAIAGATSINEVLDLLLSHVRLQSSDDISLNTASKGGRPSNNTRGRWFRGGRFNNNLPRGSRGRDNFSCGHATSQFQSNEASFRAPRPLSVAGMQCQICGRFNPSALTCYHRYENAPTAQVADAISNSDFTPWLADSGASHHITNSMQQLDVSSQYGGSDVVHFGNGDGPQNQAPSSSRQTTEDHIRCGFQRTHQIRAKMVVHPLHIHPRFIQPLLPKFSNTASCFYFKKSPL